ncbi:MAG: hypothetical protein IJV56_09750, partial [Neisseriaceae bacterium]|nr:hypothetical protein [Neisseriaceae bacterium]
MRAEQKSVAWQSPCYEKQIYLFRQPESKSPFFVVWGLPHLELSFKDRNDDKGVSGSLKHPFRCRVGFQPTIFVLGKL